MKNEKTDKIKTYIGKTFHIYDGNIRIYKDLETGEVSSSPIWKYSWQERKIVSETKISWIDNWNKKYKKKDFKENHYILFLKESINKIAEIKKIKVKIKDFITYETRNELPQNFEKFKQIEKLISSLKTT